MARSPGFGSAATDYVARLGLGFPSAPGLQSLNLARRRNSQAHSTKGTPSPPRGGSDLLWVYGFRFCFTPLAGVLFAFPSRYFCAIGRIPCLALDRGRPGFRRGFTCPAVLRIPLRRRRRLRVRGFHPLWPAFPMPFPCLAARDLAVLQPRASRPGLGSSGFARRYSRNLS